MRKSDGKIPLPMQVWVEKYVIKKDRQKIKGILFVIRYTVSIMSSDTILQKNNSLVS